MNLTMMILFHDYGPKSPRPADPSPEGGEGEPVGDDEDDDDEGGDDDRGSRDHARAGAPGGAI